MRRARIVPAVALLLLVGCGGKVADHIDALRVSRKRNVHSTLPSPERLAELYPGQEPDRRFRSRLEEDEHAKAILDAGQAAVPELVRLLDDPERRTLAAVFLAEIGGEQAATELLARWRDVRGNVETKLVYQSFERAGRPVTWKLGRRHEGIEVVKVTNLVEITSRGVLMTPALVVDGDVVSSGKVLTPARIRELIAPAT